MLAIFFVILAFFIGLLVASNLELTDFERILASFVIGIMISSWLTFLPALIFQSLKMGVIVSFFLMILALIFFRKKIHFNFKITRIELILFIFLLVFSNFVITKTLLIEKDDGIYTTLNAWGDIALHLSILNSFSNSDNFPPQYPIYAGHKLGSPFLFDFFSGILKYLNFNLRWSFLLPNILIMTILLSLFHCFVFRITKKRMIAILALVLLIFSGGLGFVNFLKDNAEQNLISAFFNNKRDYTYNPDLGYEFMNFTANLLPQRTTLFGLAFVLLIFILITPALLDKVNIGKRQLIMSGCLTGLLVMFHAHSFLSIMILLFILAVYYQRKDMIYFFLPAGMLAVLQFPFMFQQINSNGFISLHLGWMAPKNLVGFIIFWLKNFGFLLPLFMMAFFITSKRNKSLYLASTSLFIIPNIIRFQPWAYDNLKIFMVWLMILVMGAAESLYFISQKRDFGKVIGSILFGLAIFSGLLTTIFLLNETYLIYSYHELAMADWINQNTEKNTVFLTAENHNHLVPMLAGRKVYRGYGGWLWTHGLDWTERIPFVKSAYEGKSSKEELLRAGLSYIFIGPWELGTRDYKVNLEFFENNFEKIFDNQKVKIYKVNSTNL